MGGVEVLQAPSGVGSSEGVSSSPFGKLCPIPRKFFVFVVENTIF